MKTAKQVIDTQLSTGKEAKYGINDAGTKVAGWSTVQGRWILLAEVVRGKWKVLTDLDALAHHEIETFTPYPKEQK